MNGKRWTLHHGEALAYLRTLDDASVDALIADPPYSSGGFTRGDRTASTSSKYQSGGAEKREDFTGDNRDTRGFLVWCSLWMGECFRVLRAGAPVCVWSDWRQLPTMTDAIQVAGFVWRGLGAWTKCSMSRPQLGRFRADAEFLVWGSKGPHRPYDGAGVLPGSWSCPPVPSGSRVHMTEKPLEVMEAIVKICPPGGIILDPFAGSGTTGVAALRTGRHFVGCELAEGYAQTARDRLAAEESASTLDAIRAGQTALFDGGR